MKDAAAGSPRRRGPVHAETEGVTMRLSDDEADVVMRALRWYGTVDVAVEPDQLAEARAVVLAARLMKEWR